MTRLTGFMQAMKKLRDLESQFRHIQNIDARVSLWELYTEIKNELEEAYEECYELHKEHKDMVERFSKAKDSISNAMPILNEASRHLN